MPSTNDTQARHADTVCIQAVDLFCGIGGLTHGLLQAGIAVKAGLDNDLSCQTTYAQNNQPARFLHADIKDITPEQIAQHYDTGAVRLLAGCAPCQPFSSHTRKNKNSASNDDRFLLSEFSRIMQAIQPELIAIENVPGIAKHTIFEDFQTTLDTMGYQHTTKIAKCQQYGIPQTRKRLILLASRLGDIELIAPTHPHKTSWATVRQAISKTQPLAHGETSPSDPAHVSLKLSDLNLRRMRQSKPGGSWHDWDTDLISACHKTANYPAPYGRMRWDAPAPTITTQFCYYSTGRFGHPEEDRAISIREGALLQTFPADYNFQDIADPLAARVMARHIGNAVPVRLGEVIGASIRQHANQY